MVLPAGDHEVVFRFEPESYRMGNNISLVGSVLLILLTAGAFISLSVGRKKSEEDNPS